MGGVKAAMRDGDWAATTKASKPSTMVERWDVDEAYKRSWGLLSAAQRIAGLAVALRRYSQPGQQSHIQRVIAGTAQPREWLIGDVVAHAKRPPEAVPAIDPPWHRHVVAPPPTAAEKAEAERKRVADLHESQTK
jgi:hypothetical protein